MKKTSFEIKLPARTLDISSLADVAAEPEEALLLLTPSTVAALETLPDAARLEVRDLLFELGRAMQNTAFPTIRVDLDLELEPPQDWCSEVSMQGEIVRSFTHGKAEKSFALAVREAVIQATSIGITSRSQLISKWSIALGEICGDLDIISLSLSTAEMQRDAANMATAAVGNLELNQEDDNGETS